MKQGTKIRTLVDEPGIYKVADEAILVGQDKDGDRWAYFGDEDIQTWESFLDPGVWCVGKFGQDFEAVL